MALCIEEKLLSPVAEVWQCFHLLTLNLHTTANPSKLLTVITQWQLVIWYAKEKFSILGVVSVSPFCSGMLKRSDVTLLLSLFCLDKMDI